MMYSHCSKDPKNTDDVKRLGSMHPQDAMKELGITYQHATPQSMGDQWWFWNCGNIPENLPPFLSNLALDPMQYIGFGLSKIDAEKIRDFDGGDN
jgi:hypothetical protein